MTHRDFLVYTRTRNNRRSSAPVQFGGATSLSSKLSGSRHLSVTPINTAACQRVRRSLTHSNSTPLKYPNINMVRYLIPCRSQPAHTASFSGPLWFYLVVHQAVYGRQRPFTPTGDHVGKVSPRRYPLEVQWSQSSGCRCVRS